LVEQRTENPRVVGSIPTLATILPKQNKPLALHAGLAPLPEIVN
jgi:hypothetical protein